MNMKQWKTLDDVLNFLEYEDFTAAQAVKFIRDWKAKQPQSDILTDVTTLVNKLHDECQGNLTQFDEKDEDDLDLDDDELIDVTGWEAVVNVTGQIQNILNR